jgi:hypothetical protein
VYEREVMQAFSDYFGRSFKRNIGQARDGGNDGDVGVLVVECKRRKSLKTILSWYGQAKAAVARRPSVYVGALPKGVPVVVMREDGGENMVMLSLEHFLLLSDRGIRPTLGL